MRVKVCVDTTKKLVRGKKVTIEGGEARWVFFKYEWLPNFCYQCGRLDHGVKECTEKASMENKADEERMQYGAWLRGEPGKKGGWEQGRMGDENDGEGRPYKGATMGKKHVNDTLQRQKGEEKDDAHVIGLTHCQGAPSRSSKELRVTRQSKETFPNEGKVNLTLEKVISNLTPKEKDGVPP